MKRSALALVLFIVSALLLGTCGDNQSGTGQTTPSTQGLSATSLATWDNFNWDQGDWE